MSLQSVQDRLDESPTGARTSASVVSRAVFGDRVGAAIFIGSLVLFGLTWRIGVFVSDTYTVSNTMVAVADGQLHVEKITFGPTGTGDTPRMHVLDGRLYGRNYGLVVASLPFFWALAAVSHVADLGVVLPLGWSVLLVAFAVILGRIVDRERMAALVGGALAVVLFGATLALARPIDPTWLPLVALQLSTMVAAALVGTVVYRLLGRMHGRRIGVFAGAVVALGGPVGFWATLPKRHTVVALLAVVSLYCFYRSREADDAKPAARFRALAYAPVGLTAWVFVPDAAVLFVPLVVVDLATARSNHPRQLALVGGALVVSLLPALATNVLISGNPLRPPIALPAYDAATTVAGAGPVGGGAGGAGSPAGGAGSPVSRLVAGFASELLRGLQALFDPWRLFHVFVRGNLERGLHRYGALPVNLAVLEVMPLAAVLLAAPVLAARRLRAGISRPPIQTIPGRWAGADPKRATDALALAYLFVLLLAYLPRSLTWLMLTVRYLHPLYPLCAYLLTRLAFVRTTVDREWRLLGRAYAAFLVVGGPLFALALSSLASGLGEAVQLHARVSLAAAAVVGYWAIVATLTDEGERLGAVALAFAGATATAYVLLAAWSYFAFTSRFALPIARLLAEFAPL